VEADQVIFLKLVVPEDEVPEDELPELLLFAPQAARERARAKERSSAKIRFAVFMFFPPDLNFVSVYAEQKIR